MLKKANSRKTGTRIMAWVLTCVMMLSLVGVMPEPVWAESTGNTLTVDGAEVTWDLRDSAFGAYADTDGSYTTDDGILTITGAISLNGGQHGASVPTGTVFSVNVPAGKTTITVSGCAYGSANGSLQVGGTTVAASQSLGQLTTDGTDVVYEYTATEATTVDLVISGNGFIHYIKAKTVTAASEEAPSTSTEKVFDAGDMELAAKGSLTESQEVVNGDFTLIAHSNTAIEEKAVAFEDGWTSTKRLSLGGTLNTTKAAIKFTTEGPAEVKVYWIAGGDGREIKIIDGEKNEIAITSEGSVKDTQYISTLTIEEAGTYYLGSSTSSNYIFQFIVTEEAAATTVEKVFDAGDMDSAAKGSLAESQEVVNGDFTLIAHSNTAIEEKAVAFEDGWTSTKRLSLGGTLNTTKAAIKFTTEGPAEVKVYWIAGGDGREIKIIDGEKNEIAITSEGSVKDTQYISTLTIDEAGTYYLGSSTSSNYIFKFVVTEEGASDARAELKLDGKEVTYDFRSADFGVYADTDGSWTSEDGIMTITGTNIKHNGTQHGAELPSGTVISFNVPAGRTVITVSACAYGSAYGSLTVDGETVAESQALCKYATDGTDVVFKCDTEEPAVVNLVIDGKGYVHTIKARSETPKDYKTYTLTGTYNTGLEDASILTGIKFTATSESDYEVPEVTLDTANNTYSVVLEQGTSYTVSAVGTSEYDMIAPSEDINYTEDTILNLEFSKKALYDVSISLGSTPDLSGKALTYKFTHTDGVVYEFEAGKAIQLRDGVYAVEIGGDFEQFAYNIKTGDKLTVAGAAVNHAITFAEKTTWSFAPAFDAIQSTTGWYYGIAVDATTGKLATNGDNCCAALGSGTVLEVPVSGPCSITVTPHKGEAKYALYTINGVEASTTESSTTVEYTGEAGTIKIVATGSAYISSIALTYPAKDVEFEEQPVMPFVPEDDTDENTVADTDGVPRQNKQDSLTIQPVGQKLTFSQSGGKFADKFADTKDVAYYLFPMTADANKLEFDLVVTESKATGNDAGFFGGVFTDNYVYSLGLRAGGQKIRGIYSKNGGINGGSFAGAGSPAEEVVGLNREIHYCIEILNGRPSVTITFVDDAGVTQSRNWSQNAIAEPDGSTPTEFYYGFAFANISATITNMVYTDPAGNVLYAQNDCYYTEGEAPTASNVTATPAETREYIDVTWTGTVPEYDGTYVVEMQKDGGEWVELTQDVTGFSYRYMVPAGDGGNYKFRVCGQLGKESLGGDRNNWATMEDTVYVKGALEKPVVEIEVVDGKIVLNWQEVAKAEYYMVYRYSSDEGVDNATCIAEKVTTNAYTDSAVEVDVPYYYYVKAISEADENESPFSETVWTVVASERDGEYVYEDEATKIAITKKSYDTVFSNKVALEGIVYGEGTLTVFVNGTKADSKEVKARDEFAFDLTVVPGRNDVNLFFEDKDGNITRETFNFVYLTNYDVVVDAAYTGTDGELVDGIPTYKTVQAAVDAAGKAKAADRTVILVMAGSYEERLEVKTANITLIGEDRENTLIHFYPGVLGTNYEAGGDMDKRCATYIYATATGFTAENISFANDYVYGTNDGKSNKSADAIRVEADNSLFVNVSFESVQDTLYMHEGKQYYYKCEIKGLVDFIYSGDKAQSYFNDCEIIFVYEQTKNSGYVCAPKTAADAKYGLTFNNCVITAEDGCTGTAYLLARPWGADAYITWINCYMGDVIYPYAPYGDMSGNMHEDARFYEFGSYGPGYMINTDRRQISPTQAATMTSADYLGWDPVKEAADLSANYYVGSVTTDKENGATEEEVTEDKYLWTDGDDTGLKIYDMEGFADAYGVNGGGLLLETNANYYKVGTAEEFLDALLAAKTGRKATVIELTADINLGCNEVDNYADYSKIIKAHSAQPLTHPTLIESGVSQLTLEEISNLTIFSLNGASIKHTTITLKKAENIMIRNIKFDELWEWDEATEGDYDRNDWDYITVDSTCDGIWIDHCTFYKAYDGVVDIKNPNPVTNVTISWCEFLPGSENNEFFDVQMDDIYANPDKYPTYQHMKEEGMTDEDVYVYAYGQKKTHLFGQSDDSVNAVGLQITLANNHYFNSMDRLPRLRYGISHVYNCVMDAQALLDARLAISNPDIAKKIVSNGAASTCGGHVLLENCFISGIQNALNSGNGSSPAGYINAINSVYYMDGIKTDLAVKNNTSADDDVLITDADAFIESLPYSDYVLYDAEELRGIVPYYAGAGKLDLTVLQWEKTSYNTAWKEPVVNEIPELPQKGDMDFSVVYMITLLGCAFVTAGFFAKKKFATEE